MARYLFVSDPLISSVLGTVVLPANQPFQLWTDRSGGTLVTDCTAPDGITTLSLVNGYFTADGSGKPPDFRGPDGIVMLWLDAGAGRFPVVAVDLLAQLLDSSIGWLAGNFPGGTGGVTAHGQLSGLSADDHQQYHTDARGDLRYYLKAAVDQAIASAVTTSSAADRSRANHSGTQLASSISDFATAVQTVAGPPYVTWSTATQGTITAAKVAAAGIPNNSLIVVVPA